MSATTRSFPRYLRLDSASTLVGGSGDDSVDGGDSAKLRRKTALSDIDEEDDTSDTTPHLLRAFSRSNSRRQLQYFLVLLCISLFTLFRSVLPFSPQQSSQYSSRPLVLPPTLVGPRPLTASHGRALYDSCTAEEFLEAIKGSKVREDGASRTIDMSPVQSLEVPRLNFSMDFPDTSRCAPPRVYNQAEACELLGSFGGIYMLGDSYIRHVYTALLILLRDRLDGAVVDYLKTDDCAGEHMFVEAETCRIRVPEDTLNVPSDVPALCGGKVHMRWLLRWDTAGGRLTDIADYATWRSRLPSPLQSHSTLFLEGYGLHFSYDFPLSIPWLSRLSTFISSTSYPRPINIFSGPHHPASNQDPKYVVSQGPEKVKAFTEELDSYTRENSEPKEVSLGAARMIDFFEATKGAASFDGAHLSYQGNMEKAQLLLGLLDIIHGDIVSNGGLVVTPE
ncbi:hypothetical protein JCM11641_002617 [Rhodosporidiobolus odoratus]